jgi:CRP-like cAMP-binding protein
MADRPKRPDARRLNALVNEQKALLEADPENVAAKLTLASALRDLGDTAAALELYRELARFHHRQGKNDQAAAVCRLILELAPAEQEFIDLQRVCQPAARQATPTTEMETIRQRDSFAASGLKRRRVLRRQGLGEVGVSPEGLRGFGEARAYTVEPEADEMSDSALKQEDTPSRGVGADVREAAREAQSDRAPQAEPYASQPTRKPRQKKTNPSLRALRDIWNTDDEGELAPLADGEEQTFDALLRQRKTPVVDGAGPTEPEIALTEIPMFADLPQEAFAELSDRLVRRREAADSVIVRQGDPGNAFFVVVSGRVRVEKRDEGGQRVHLANLGPGAFFGEFALLSDRRRHATVIADQQAVILEISRKVMGRLAKNYSGVAKTLRRFYRRRLLATVMSSAPFFGPLSTTEKRRLMAHLRFRKFSPNEDIIQEQARGGGFYLILLGEVQVSKSTDGKRHILARMGEGAYFGEMSLLKNRPTAATVTAVTHTEVVELDAKDFYRILGKHPEIWQEVNREARRRELANHALLTGKTQRVDPPNGGFMV